MINNKIDDSQPTSPCEMVAVEQEYVLVNLTNLTITHSMVWLMSNQMILSTPLVIIDCRISQQVHLNSISLDCDTPSTEDAQVKKSDAIYDLKDPAKLSVIKNSLQTALVKHGPFQVKNFKGPKNDQNRRFYSTHFIRRLENGESIERQCLVYSTSSDTVFLFLL